MGFALATCSVLNVCTFLHKCHFSLNLPVTVFCRTGMEVVLFLGVFLYSLVLAVTWFEGLIMQLLMNRPCCQIFMISN